MDETERKRGSIESLPGTGSCHVLPKKVNHIRPNLPVIEDQIVQCHCQLEVSWLQAENRRHEAIERCITSHSAQEHIIRNADYYYDAEIFSVVDNLYNCAIKTFDQGASSSQSITPSMAMFDAFESSEEYKEYCSRNVKDQLGAIIRRSKSNYGKSSASILGFLKKQRALRSWEAAKARATTELRDAICKKVEVNGEHTDIVNQGLLANDIEGTCYFLQSDIMM